jgi:branched-chain amino acid transport system permease protein
MTERTEESERTDRTNRLIPVDTDSKWLRKAAYAILGLALLIAPLILPLYQTYLLTQALVLGLFATGFNLLYGYTGLLSFGHAMFFGGAGYVVGIFLNEIGPESVITATFGGSAPLVAFIVAGVLGIAFATALSIPVGYLSVRLEEIYFAIITLSFSMALYILALNDIGGLTNGSNGLTVILDTATIAGFELALTDRRIYYFVVLAVVVPSMYLLWRVVRSPFGMACKAVRENPERAAAAGINVRQQRWISFILSAVFAGVAGVLIVPLHGVVAPELTYWTTSAEPVIISVLGGPFRFIGPVLGAFAFEYFRWLVSQSTLLGGHWQLLFGLLIMAVVLFFKGGISGGLIVLKQWLGQLVSNYRTGGTSAAKSFVGDSIRTLGQKLRSMLGRRSHHDSEEGLW